MTIKYDLPIAKIAEQRILISIFENESEYLSFNPLSATKIYEMRFPVPLFFIQARVVMQCVGEKKEVRFST